MPKKTKTPFFILSLLITITFLGGIGWWIFKSYDLSKLDSSTSTPNNSSLQPNSKLEKLGI